MMVDTRTQDINNRGLIIRPRMKGYWQANQVTLPNQRSLDIDTIQLLEWTCTGDHWGTGIWWNLHDKLLSFGFVAWCRQMSRVFYWGRFAASSFPMLSHDSRQPEAICRENHVSRTSLSWSSWRYPETLFWHAADASTLSNQTVWGPEASII